MGQVLWIQLPATALGLFALYWLGREVIRAIRDVVLKRDEYREPVNQLENLIGLLNVADVENAAETAMAHQLELLRLTHPDPPVAAPTEPATQPHGESPVSEVLKFLQQPRAGPG